MLRIRRLYAQIAMLASCLVGGAASQRLPKGSSTITVPLPDFRRCDRGQGRNLDLGLQFFVKPLEGGRPAMPVFRQR